MKTLALRKKVAGAALVLAALFGVTVATSATAQAQYRGYGYSQQVRWDKNRTRAYAFALGYHTAYSEAQEARSRGFRGDDVRDSYGYRNTANGWLAWMGYEEDYRRSYREGFEDGFRDGMNGRNRRYGRDEIERLLGANPKDVYGDDRYDRDGYWRRDDYWRNRRGYRDNDRNGRYDRNEVMRIAQQNGYRDGFAEGRQDSAQRRRYNLNDSRAYRDALRGYQSQYGDRDVYRRAYREGFQRGYADGFRNNNNNGRGPWRRP